MKGTVKGTPMTQKEPPKVEVAPEFVVLRDTATGKLIVARREWLTT